MSTTNSTASINPEIEAVVAESSQTNIINQNAVAAATIEQANELVALEKDTVTKKWTLSLGQGYGNKWRNATEDDEIADRNGIFVVSLLGNTTAGKSFVTKHLLTNAENSPQIVEENEIESSTTGNINCYQSKLTNDLVEKMLVLDYEGEKGSSFPLMLHARRFFAEHIGLTTEYGKERRKAVTQYFPKLAYVLSNIVILIGKEELISADYLNRCYEFTRSANTNITNIPYLPVLIIIENKCSLAKKFGIDEVTDEFFRIHRHEADDLKKYFSKIYCVRLPHTQQLQKVNKVVVDGEAIFEQQLSTLKKIIEEIILQDRKRLITYAQWLFLLRLVLDNVSNGKAVSIHTLLSQITSSTDNHEDQSATRKFFERIYQTEDIHTPKFYRDCRGLAMQMFSRSVAIKLLQQEKILSDRFIRDTCKTQMQMMWEMLDDYKPCEALYTGDGVSVSGNPVFCYQCKGAHPRHRTYEGIKNTSWASSLFGWSSTVVWDGDFVSRDNGKLIEKELENFSNLTVDFVNSFKQNPQEKLTTFKAILERAHFHGSPLISQIRRCNCCLERKRLNISGNLTWTYFFRLMYPARFTICRDCHDELADMWLRDSSDTSPRVTRGVSVAKTSASCTNKNDDDCIICMDAKKEYIVVPCGHKGFCFNCATLVQQAYKFCPLCREDVQSILKVFDV